MYNWYSEVYPATRFCALGFGLGGHVLDLLLLKPLALHDGRLFRVLGKKVLEYYGRKERCVLERLSSELLLMSGKEMMSEWRPAEP